MIFSHNNPAKEWILQELAARADRGPFSVCDLACGSGSVWPAFLLEYPSVRYVGKDTDAAAIERGRKAMAGIPNARMDVADAQILPEEEGSYDVVTALSALEHVVRIDKFLDTVFRLLKPGGVAYLNYDDGHFTSHNPKERIMVPVSQVLALVGIEGPYMKRVNDADIIRLIEERGGKVLAVRKNNLAAMKGFTKGHKSGLMGDDVLREWFAFENRLNDMLSPAQLSKIFGATTVVMQKT
ncbi:methyltransferase domain-containing protein [Patescibacteria group bacterium]|uniref:Methyltransferase domain-containing protein n=1 Tax=candidate division WWE3 bacterium TaxID=2053526 RepID=A0A928TQZ6_UNCKA|nr:methyltransferase domain-containing protein [candidate division WWE3 bacterium]MCL4732597.1 methyltransferase domain-containing protein [Patescibacteria group bacterium]MDL1952749.1 methyltransferase domain-containing protein [Candidatus Uhrbacteria bacterium UHB]RIL01123.1 MAG: hypothetical protein DCC77_01105 [Candidatus Uhrbacteria bacterium]